MAQVRLPGTGELNPLMADFAAHYGFAVKTHRVRRPRTKGKVERMVDYLKDNFLNGRSFAGLSDLSAKGSVWLEEANRRVHATTGEHLHTPVKRPIDLLPREKLARLDLARPYVLAERHERRVNAEGFVQFSCSHYSVPPQYVGKRIVLVQREQKVQIRCGETVIAEHGLATTTGSCIADKAHIEAMWSATRVCAASESTAGSVVRTPAKTPVPKVNFTDVETVSARSLTEYEEIIEQ